ncbi:hypothetical protein SprV_0100196400 [Sparganum proliferum]
MEPPKAKTIDKKLGSIYFSGKCLLAGPYEVKDNEVFGTEGGNKAMKASMEKKKGVKTNIIALADSLRFQRKSKLGRKPPHKSIKYMHIKHYYQFAQQEKTVILALQIPKTPKQYIALTFAEMSTTTQFCDVVQYASVASNHNLKHAAPPPEVPTVNAPAPESSTTPSTTLNRIQSPAPYSAEPLSSSSSPSASRKSATSHPRTPITEILEQDIASTPVQLRDGSSRSNSRSSSAYSNHLTRSQMTAGSKSSTSHTVTPKPYSTSTQLKTPSESPTSQRTPSPFVENLVSSSAFETSPPNNTCPRCSQVNLNLMDKATSPVFAESPATSGEYANNAQPETLYQKTVSRKDMISPNVNSSLQQQAPDSSMTIFETNKYDQEDTKSSEFNHVQERKEEHLYINNSRGPVKSTSPDFQTSSASSYSTPYQSSRDVTPDRSSKSQMILVSKTFQPLSVLTKNRPRENSINDTCTICGSVGEGGPMQLKILRVDVDGQPKISPDGAVYMYSSTKQVRQEDSEKVNGYKGRSSQHHNGYREGKEERFSNARIWRLDNSSSGSSSDSDDLINEWPPTAAPHLWTHSGENMKA